jgi:hypothetical protein
MTDGTICTDRLGVMDGTTCRDWIFMIDGTICTDRFGVIDGPTCTRPVGCDGNRHSTDCAQHCP